MSESRASGERSVSIGGDAKDVTIVTGDGNTLSRNDLTALHEALVDLCSNKRSEIDDEFAKIEGELAESEPDQDKVSDAMSRAIRYAAEAQDFAATIAKLKPQIQRIASWLGKRAQAVLAAAGLGA